MVEMGKTAGASSLNNSFGRRMYKTSIAMVSTCTRVLICEKSSESLLLLPL